MQLRSPQSRFRSGHLVCRECFLFNKSSTRMRPPRSPAKCIHHVAIFSSPMPPAPEAATQPTEGASTPTTTPRGPAAAPASALRDADAPPAAAAGPYPAQPLRSPPPLSDAAAGRTPSGGAPTPTPVAAAAAPRATALSPDSRLCGILSQIDVMRFLNDRAQAECSSGQAGCAVFHRNVKELGLVGFAMSEIPPSPSTTSSENSERMSKGFAGPRMTLLPVRCRPQLSFCGSCRNEHRPRAVCAYRAASRRSRRSGACACSGAAGRASLGRTARCGTTCPPLTCVGSLLATSGRSSCQWTSSSRGGRY